MQHSEIMEADPLLTSAEVVNECIGDHALVETIKGGNLVEVSVREPSIAKMHNRGVPNIVFLFLFASQSQHRIRTRCASGGECRSYQRKKQHCEGGKCKH